MAGKANKQYGLILPSKGQSSRAPTVPRKNVFGDDSDSDSDDGGDWVKKSLKREAQKSVLKRTTKVQMQKAVAEDPTVFQYDEIYEDMEQKRVEVTTAKKGVEKKPRYIQALLQTAERRKKENERRIERQVQKEREEEGNQFADKESFVTSSYRQKLEEFKKQEEEEKRMDRLEAIGDVTKQKDLTGFYRHMYRQTMGESLAGIGDAIIAEKEDSETNKNVEVASENFEKTGKKVVAETNQKKDRQYRKRCSSSSSSEESGKESRANNSSKGKSIDADSDFTGSSSSSSENESSVTGSGSEEGEIRKKKVSKAASNEVDVPKKKQKKLETHDKSDKNLDDTPLVKNDSVTQVFKVKEETEPSLDKLCVKSEAEDTDNHKNESDTGDSRGTVEVKKTKVDIWAKRTIGDVFDDAVRRYYERKAARVTFKRA